MEKELKEQVNQNARMISHHVGLGGKAHAPVNDFNAGFMTPVQKTALETASADAKNGRGEIIVMANGTDWNTLPPGTYKITNALNNPIAPDDRSVTLYDIKSPYSGTKIVTATLSSIGRMYYRTIHGSGDLSSGTGGWMLFKPMDVWIGSAQSGTITYGIALDANLAISYTEVIYNTVTGQTGSIKIYGNSGGYGTINTTNLGNDSTDGQYQNYESKVIVTREGLTIDSNFAKIVAASGSYHSDEKFISIIRVRVC